MRALILVLCTLTAAAAPPIERVPATTRAKVQALIDGLPAFIAPDPAKQRIAGVVVPSEDFEPIRLEPTGIPLDGQKLALVRNGKRIGVVKLNANHRPDDPDYYFNAVDDESEPQAGDRVEAIDSAALPGQVAELRKQLAAKLASWQDTKQPGWETWPIARTLDVYGLPQLTQALKSADRSKRLFAYRLLGRLPRRAAFPVIWSALQREPDGALAREAVRAMTRWRDQTPAPVAALAIALKPESAAVAVAELSKLSRMDGALMGYDQLLNIDPAKTASALTAAIRRKPDRKAHQLELDALMRLSWEGYRWREALGAEMAKPQPTQVKVALVLALRDNAERHLVATLADWLKEPKMRIHALSAIAGMNRAYPVLEEPLISLAVGLRGKLPDDYQLRATLWQALSHYEDMLLVEPLLARLKQGGAGQEWAAYGLRNYRQTRVIDALIAALGGKPSRRLIGFVDRSLRVLTFHGFAAEEKALAARWRDWWRDRRDDRPEALKTASWTRVQALLKAPDVQRQVLGAQLLRLHPGDASIELALEALVSDRQEAGRLAAVYTLNSLTKVRLGYRRDGDAASRAAARSRWQAWWARARGKKQEARVAMAIDMMFPILVEAKGKAFLRAHWALAAMVAWDPKAPLPKHDYYSHWDHDRLRRLWKAWKADR